LLSLKLNSKLLSVNKKINVFLEVNVSGEESKYGVNPEKLKELAKEIFNLPQLEFKGLMTMAPLSDNPENARSYFKKLHELASDTEEFTGKGLRYLSMGMTDDFEVAIEEGANIVRIGRGIFD
jgi:pyridoxal phosphate enzyme (YggS family)